VDQTAPPVLGRDLIIEHLRHTLEGLPAARAAFLGGSDASGRTDALSDIDLVVLCAEGAVEECLAEVRAGLGALSPLAHRWRVPTAPGSAPDRSAAQEFLALRDADPAHFVDVVVIPVSASERYLEPERHGQALVLFDRDGLIHPDPLDRAALQRRIEARVSTLRERFPMFQTLVSRAVARGFVAEAAVAYQDHCLRPLVELLRIRHCPDRFDFGPRYLDRDLPEEVRAEVESLALPGSLAQVEAFRSRAQTLFEATLAQLDAAAEPGRDHD
jgi:hypothetical protein